MGLRLVIALLFLVFFISVVCRKGGRYGSRGTSGSRGQLTSGGKVTGSKGGFFGSGNKGGIFTGNGFGYGSRGNFHGNGHRKGTRKGFGVHVEIRHGGVRKGHRGNKFGAGTNYGTGSNFGSGSHHHGSVGNPPVHFVPGSVYGWHYSIPPVYIYGGDYEGYKPSIKHPIYGRNRIRCGMTLHKGCAYYSASHKAYHYYTGPEHLYRSTKRVCSRPVSDLDAKDFEALLKSTRPKESSLGLNETDIEMLLTSSGATNETSLNATDTGILQETSTSGLPKELAWECPRKSLCCGWECCQDPKAVKSNPHSNQRPGPGHAYQSPNNPRGSASEAFLGGLIIIVSLMMGQLFSQ